MQRFPFLFGEKQETNRFSLIKRKINALRQSKRIQKEALNNETRDSSSK